MVLHVDRARKYHGKADRKSVPALRKTGFHSEIGEVRTMILKKPNPNITDKEFYLRSFTWGLPVNVGGALAAAVLLITGHKPERFGNCVNFTVGKNWGGGSAGVFLFTCKNASRKLKEHEQGHSIQNCYYGPLMLFVNLQSTSRYLYRLGAKKLAPKITLPPYDSAWYEGEATALGKAFMARKREEEKVREGWDRNNSAL